MPVSWEDVRFNCDTCNSQPRFSFTVSFRHQVFVAFHSRNHSEANATARLVPQRYIFPRVEKDCRTCSRICAYRLPQRWKVCRQVRTTSRASKLRHIIFTRQYLPGLNGVRLVWISYCHTAMDTHVRLKQYLSPSSPPRHSQGFSRCLGCFFSYPQQITTYQGRQFEALIFKTLSTFTGSSLCSNGMFGSLHWQQRLPWYAMMMSIEPRRYRWFCYEICNVWNDDLQYSSEKVVQLNL